MRRILRAASVLLFSSTTAMASLITQPADVDPKSPVSIDRTIESLLKMDQAPRPEFGTLTEAQRHALMLVSMQNGQIDAAMSIAESLAATRKDDITVQALLAGRRVQRYELPAAENLLRTLTPRDKSEIASVELIWALLETSRDNDRKALQHVDKVLAQLPDHPYARNVRGVLLVGDRRFVEAKREFERALQKIPKMDAAEANWGFAELHDGRPTEALTHFDRAIALNSGNCQARYGKATLVRGQGNPSLALDVLGACLDNRQDLGIRMLATESMLDLGKNTEAVTYLRQTDGLEADSQARLLMAKASLRTGDADTALRYANGPDPQAQYYKSVALLAKGEPANAQLTLRPLLKGTQGPANARLVESIAKLLLKQPLVAGELQLIAQNQSLAPFAALLNSLAATDPETAARHFRNSAGLLQGGDYSGVQTSAITRQLKSPHMSDIVAALFFDLMNMQSTTDRYLSKAQKADDGFLTHYLLGMRALQSGTRDVAIGHLRKSLQIDPRFFSAQFLLAETYMQDNQLNPALAEYEKAIALKAEPGASLKAGLVAERLNKLEVAEKHLRAVIQVAPANFIGYNQLAWFLVSHNRKLDEAVTLATKATQLMPNDPNTLDTLGWAHYTKGQYALAVSTLQRANQLSGGNNAGVLFHLAMAERKAGNNRSALDNAQRSKSIGVQPGYVAQLDQLIQELKRAN